MMLFGSIFVRERRELDRLSAAGLVVVLFLLWAAPAYGQRVFGLDTSSAANASAPSQNAWNNAFNDADGDGIAYKFGFVRSSRGGLTAAEQRLDDAHFYDNISRGTAAGLLMGSYHFARGDLAPMATPAGTNTATGDATHYLERAGMYMKPGYLLPVFDMEDGNVEHSQASLTAWSMEWLNTIYNAKGFYPIVYTNSSYNNDEVGDELAFFDHASDPTPHTQPRTYQWVARPSGNLQTGEPGAATNYPNPYGAWDPNFITRTNSRDPAVNPWAFWQNGAGSPNGFLIDFNAANGNIEFVKDFLVPALWTNAGSGDWGTIANWNSDNPGYVAGNTSTGPAPRLPNNQSLDWVKLQNPGGGTVTISSGARTVRKFYTQQPFNITGGSLTVGYVPGSGGKWDLPSEFKSTVTLSGTGAYSAHTTQVDGGGGRFDLNGGTVTFRSIDLASHSSNPGQIFIGGDITFAPTGGSGTSVIRSIGDLAELGAVHLTPGNRMLTVNNGSAAVDLNIRAYVTGPGGRLVKSGPGTMQLSTTNFYSGGTTLSGGVLQIADDDRLGAIPGSLQSDNVILDGGTLRTGAQINSVSLTNSGIGYTSFPTLSIGGDGGNVLPASANVLAGISSIAVPTGGGGSGYVDQAPGPSPPSPGSAGTFVDIVGGGGTGATARATVVGGTVTGITIINAGSGYTSMPTIHISSTAIAGVAGSGATASVNGINLQGIALNDGGFDYTNPTISLTGGGGAGATASATSTPNQILPSNRGITLTAIGGTLEQTAGTTIVINGPIGSTGNGTLTKSGAGTLVLNGDNTYSGTTLINGGILRTGAGEHLPDTSHVNVTSPGTLDLNGSSETIGSLEGNGSVTNISLLSVGGDNSSTTFTGSISGSGSLQKTGTGTMTLSGSNSYSGGTNIVDGALSGNSIANQGANSAFGTSNFSIANGATLEYTGFTALTNRTISLDTGGGTVSVSNVGSLRVNGIISGTSLTKAGAGTLSLGGVNTYAGATTINEGVLQLGNHERVPNTSRVVVNSSGTFDANGFAETIGSLEGDGSVINVDVLTAGGDGTSSTFSGTLDGGSLIKGGAGTMTLSGVNSYFGGTEISGGTLSGNSIADQGINSAFGTADFTVANGATLEYTGPEASTNRNITLDAGGGIVSVPSGASQLTVNGVISGSALTKTGSGSLVLTSPNTYAGETIVNGGLLVATGATATLGGGDVTVLDGPVGSGVVIHGGAQNAIDDGAALNLFGGGTPDLADWGFAFLDAGITEIVGSLFLDGVMQPNGTYGGTGSGAMHIMDEYFGGSGILQVGLAPPIFAGDYNDDGIIDAADYVAWRKFVGEPAGTLPNDNTGQPIGDDQYNLWTTNYGNVEAGGGGGTVPEPSFIALLMLTLAALPSGRRRR